MAIYIGDNEAELLPIDATQSQEVVLWCMISDINKFAKLLTIVLVPSEFDNLLPPLRLNE